ncbi:hypothetical protein [Companilactobacillus nuruki]|uniref:Uncharacterized protein n=1 Tax=Companilactobacillus nuruki TaxID=1993540 RepID=A0A2N7AX17_9LACO|nr:hypothetical protein [Companilactobacillus nuruki]PMD73301.1 hypothetical protein CBP76_02115 [Companilactobacillus nuruki]
MQTLDQSKLYYRRVTSLDIVTLIMIIGLLFFPSGYLLSLLLIVVYPFSHSKILVSDIGDRDVRIWVRTMDWNHYRKLHGINFLAQYKSQGSTVHIKQV